MSWIRHALVGCLAVSGPASGASAQVKVFEMGAAFLSSARQVVSLGDMNGDGCPDFAISVYGNPWSPQFNSWVWFFSGKDRSFIDIIANPAPGTQNFWGESIGTIGDVDGDGVPDSYVGMRWGAQVAMIYSGKSRQYLATLAPAGAGRVWPDAGLGDVDGDGFGDILVSGVWPIAIVSGKTLAVIRVLQNSQAVAGAAAVGDVDRDGRTDAIVPQAGNVASCYSGRTGQLIWTHAMLAPFSPAGDINGDGIPDIIGFGNVGPSTPFDAEVSSGVDGSPIYRFPGSTTRPLSFAARTGDLDSDGFSDFALGFNGVCEVHSGKDGKAILAIPRSTVEEVRCIAPLGDLNRDGFPELGILYSNRLEGWSRAEPAFSTFGAGCSSTYGAPALAALGGQVPRLGIPFDIQVSHMPPLAAAFLNIGFSKSIVFGLPLPMDLGFIGMPTCTLYCSADITLPIGNITGAATTSIPIGSTIDFIGVEFWVQAVVADRTANLLGLVLSNAGQAKIGN